MSYRDIRNFTEMMRSLGYPRLISMENFRTPNFELVAEILKWLVERYDPTVMLSTDIDTEQDRVIFIKSIAQFIATKAHIKLNTKRLYMADGYAVKELLKVTTVLRDAMRAIAFAAKDDSSKNHTLTSFDIASKMHDLKAVRQLASDVTQRGATLYHLLSKEPDLRDARLTALAQPLDINTIEKGLRSSIMSVESDVKKTLHKLDNIAADEANLEKKIEKRKAELERSRKRLATLHNVRPAFMDEFERLEDELKQQYEDYLIKFRNMTFLEHQMEDHNRLESVKVAQNEQSLVQIQKRLKDEERKDIITNDFFENDDLDDPEDSESDDDLNMERADEDRSRPQNPARPNAGVRRPMYVDDEDTLSSSDVDGVDDDEEDLDDDDISADELLMREAVPDGQGSPVDVDLDDDNF